MANNRQNQPPIILGGAKGFTLVEILVSVAIMVILAAVVMFWSTDAEQKAALTRADAEAEQLAAGAVMFFQENGRWAFDVSTVQDAEFYDPKYIDVDYSQPSTYLGSNYTWDWQNWGNDPINPQNGVVFSSVPANLMCWQSIDLYHRVGAAYNLALRKCVRNICGNQKYCDETGTCYATAANRNVWASPLGDYQAIGVTAVCENCTDEASCTRMFQPH